MELENDIFIATKSQRINEYSFEIPNGKNTPRVFPKKMLR